jgi:hypothetical protein
MILSFFIIGMALGWLMIETDWLRCDLMGEIPEPTQTIEQRKHNPSFELGRAKNASYPETKLLAGMCGN